MKQLALSTEQAKKLHGPTEILKMDRRLEWKQRMSHYSRDNMRVQSRSSDKKELSGRRSKEIREMF